MILHFSLEFDQKSINLMALIRNFEIDESECCGNGCANCILYINPIKTIESKKENYRNKPNCLLIYNDYKLLEKKFLKLIF